MVAFNFSLQKSMVAFSIVDYYNHLYSEPAYAREITLALGHQHGLFLMERPAIE